jgi:hypothetical protein
MACLNLADPAEHPWTVWDRELVEKVATESDLSPELVESIEGPRRSWLSDLFTNWSDQESGHHLSEMQIYRRVAATIRVLAQAGRAIIVGRGSVYATSDLRGGIHLRLVAPLESRIEHMAGELNVCPQKATTWIEQMDRQREAFHRRCSGGKALLPEIFTLTLNSQLLSHEQMVSCVLPLVPINHNHHLVQHTDFS